MAVRSVGESQMGNANFKSEDKYYLTVNGQTKLFITDM